MIFGFFEKIDELDETEQAELYWILIKAAGIFLFLGIVLSFFIVRPAEDASLSVKVSFFFDSIFYTLILFALSLLLSLTSEAWFPLLVDVIKNIPPLFTRTMELLGKVLHAITIQLIAVIGAGMKGTTKVLYVLSVQLGKMIEYYPKKRRQRMERIEKKKQEIITMIEEAVGEKG